MDADMTRPSISWIIVRGISKGHGIHMVHFYRIFVQIPPIFGECSVNLHSMRRFRRFILEMGCIFAVHHPSIPLHRLAVP